ncbi:MAG: TrmH family RNA methyltransferase [bacterium]
MEIIKLSSKQNNNLKFLRKIKNDNKYLKENNLFIIDDYLTFLEFIKNNKITNIDYKIQKIFTYNLEIIEDIKNYLSKSDLKIYLVDKDTLIDIFKVDNLKIAALVNYNLKQNIINFEFIRDNKYVIILDSIENPGNLGSIFRNSLAFEIFNLVLVNIKTGVYNTLSLRASKGSLFYLFLYFINDYSNFLDFIYKSLNNIRLNKNDVAFILAENTQDSIKINEFNIISDFIGKYRLIFIVFGNEEIGINNRLKELIKSNFDVISLRIEISNKIDSINVSCANAIFNFVLKNI